MGKMRKKIKFFQVCDASRKRAVFEVPSISHPGKFYKVTVEFTDGIVTCDCLGFKYRGTCRHTQLQEDRCGWSELESQEAQTMAQKREGICPRCGSKTVKVMRGDYYG